MVGALKQTATNPRFSMTTRAERGGFPPALAGPIDMPRPGHLYVGQEHPAVVEVHQKNLAVRVHALDDGADHVGGVEPGQHRAITGEGSALEGSGQVVGRAVDGVPLRPSRESPSDSRDPGLRGGFRRAARRIMNPLEEAVNPASRR